MPKTLTEATQSLRQAFEGMSDVASWIDRHALTNLCSRAANDEFYCGTAHAAGYLESDCSAGVYYPNIHITSSMAINELVLDQKAAR